MYIILAYRLPLTAYRLPLTAYRLPLTADFQAKEKREPSLVALAESSNFVASCN